MYIIIACPPASIIRGMLSFESPEIMANAGTRSLLWF